MRIARITCQAEIEVPESAVQILDFEREHVIGYELAEMGFENFEHGKTDIGESHISNPHEDGDYE